MIYLLFLCISTFAKMGKMCNFFLFVRVNFSDFKKFLITNNTGCNFCLLNICDVKEITKREKIR